MARRARRNQGDRDKDTSALAIDSDVLRSLVTAVTQAMMTAISNATVPVPVTPKTITYSSIIDPYDDESLETKKKEGKYRWHLNTKTVEGWKNDGISAYVDHAGKILDLFKDQFGLDTLIKIPTYGTGEVHVTPKNIFGVYHWNAH